MRSCLLEVYQEMTLELMNPDIVTKQTAGPGETSGKPWRD